jgi:hypothetical protein
MIRRDWVASCVILPVGLKKLSAIEAEDYCNHSVMEMVKLKWLWTESCGKLSWGWAVEVRKFPAVTGRDKQGKTLSKRAMKRFKDGKATKMGRNVLGICPRGRG